MVSKRAYLDNAKVLMRRYSPAITSGLIISTTASNCKRTEELRVSLASLNSSYRYYRDRSVELARWDDLDNMLEI